MDRVGIPVYASVRPDSQSLAVDSGKGFDPIQAKCSAAMEALERYYCDEADLVQWEGYPIPNCVTDFPLTAGAHFNPAYQHIWTEATVWTGREAGAKTAVPYYCVKLYSNKIPLYQMCFQNGTNGLAAGNDIEEAICSGLFEVIERDGVSLYMYGNEPRLVDHDSIEYPDCIEMLEMCENAGVAVFVYDVTSDIGVPVFACIMVDRQMPQIGMYKGYGAHLDSHIAMRRAICEAAQSRAVFISGARDDLIQSTQKFIKQIGASRDWEKYMSGEKRHNHLPSCQELSDHDTITYVEEMLKRQNCGRVLVVEILERPNLALVKVLVSHLCGYWNRYLEPGPRVKHA
jgi:ribosomal protein S12 methylthiotransferase accessory factor